MELVKFEVIPIKRHPELTERWVQDRIAEDPSILGLGDLELKDRERLQPRAGRLDLLLQDTDSLRRYEVELQLGATDESHIIRTIEYWDIERKRYPRYDHAAVLVAEDITSRFLNVISLLNGTVPLIAIQMKALSAGGQVGLFFTKVVDQLVFGPDEDEERAEPTDRNYWEYRGSKQSLAMADQLLQMARTHDASLELNYKKGYVGLATDGQATNFVIFRPKKGCLRIEPLAAESSVMQERLESAGLDARYDPRWGRYRISLRPGDIDKNKELLQSLISEAQRIARGSDGAEEQA